jgi:hypothetical protein
MVKVIDGKSWRFFSDYKPYKLENFNRTGKSEILLEPESLSDRLAGVFQMPVDKIAAALSWIQRPLIEYRYQSGIQPAVMERAIQ